MKKRKFKASLIFYCCVSCNTFIIPYTSFYYIIIIWHHYICLYSSYSYNMHAIGVRVKCNNVRRHATFSTILDRSRNFIFPAKCAPKRAFLLHSSRQFLRIFSFSTYVFSFLFISKTPVPPLFQPSPCMSPLFLVAIIKKQKLYKNRTIKCPNVAGCA